MKYVIDTCSILAASEGEIYEKEYFPVHWQNFDLKVDSGLIVSTSLVYRELEQQNDEFYEWAKNRKHIFKPPLDNVQDELINLQDKFKKWVQHNNKKHAYWADPELVAYSKANGLILVTQEKQPNVPFNVESYKIPTICSNLGVECIDMLELFKREKLHIVLK